MSMFVPLMSYQIGVSPQYFRDKEKQTAADNFVNNSSNKKIMYVLKKSIAWFYHFKIEILAVAILINMLEILTVISTIYFVMRLYLVSILSSKYFQ